MTEPYDRLYDYVKNAVPKGKFLGLTIELVHGCVHKTLLPPFDELKNGTEEDRTVWRNLIFFMELTHSWSDYIYFFVKGDRLKLRIGFELHEGLDEFAEHSFPLSRRFVHLIFEEMQRSSPDNYTFFFHIREWIPLTSGPYKGGKHLETQEEISFRTVLNYDSNHHRIFQSILGEIVVKHHLKNDEFNQSS